MTSRADTRATTSDHEGWGGLWILLVVVAGGTVLIAVIVAIVLAITGTQTRNAAQPTSTVTVAVPIAAPSIEGGGPLLTQFSDGEYIVGQDITAGNYQTAGGAGCYWERLSNPAGGFTGIISNGYPTTTTTVRVLASDKAFDVKGGCQWVKLP